MTYSLSSGPTIVERRLWRKTICTAVVVPCVFWTGPHLFWMAGVPLGISNALLTDGRDLSLTAQLTVTFSPVLGAALTALLLRPLARRFPRALPMIGGRRVPRALPSSLAGAIGVLILAYGFIEITVTTHDPAGNAVALSDLTSGWALTMRQLVFVFWGGALVASALGFARATTVRACNPSPA